MDLCQQSDVSAFNMLSRFVIALLSRSKHLLISWLQSQFIVILGVQKNKVCYSFHFYPISMPWSEGTRCHDLNFLSWVLSHLFHSPLSLSLRLFGSSSLSAIKVVSSAYLRLLIFLPAILIPAYNSSSLEFHIMNSTYQLNKQNDNIQPWHTHFPILNRSCVPCPVLTVASWPAYRFPRRQVRWSGILISFRTVYSLLWFIQPCISNDVLCI